MGAVEQTTSREKDVLGGKASSLEKSWYIDPQQPVFTGHFPGNPIMPGVLVLGLLKSLISEHVGKPVQIAAIKRQKFMRPVLPTNTLTITVGKLEMDGDFIDLQYQASVAEGPVAKGSISVKQPSSIEQRNSLEQSNSLEQNSRFKQTDSH